MVFVEIQKYENPKHLKLSKPLLILGEPRTSQKSVKLQVFLSSSANSTPRLAAFWDNFAWCS